MSALATIRCGPDVHLQIDSHTTSSGNVVDGVSSTSSVTFADTKECIAAVHDAAMAWFAACNSKEPAASSSGGLAGSSSMVDDAVGTGDGGEEGNDTAFDEDTDDGEPVEKLRRVE